MKFYTKKYGFGLFLVHKLVDFWVPPKGELWVPPRPSGAAVTVTSSGKPPQSQDLQTRSCGLVARPRPCASCLGLCTSCPCVSDTAAYCGTCRGCRCVRGSAGRWRLVWGRGGGEHAHGNAARLVVDDLDLEGEWAAETVKRPPQQPARAPVRQVLVPGNAETTPAGAPAAAADRTRRPDATCEGKNG